MDLSFLREWALVSLVILIQLIMLVGLFGLILPVFPGVLIIWLAALGYGILVGFNGLGVFLFILITILMLIASVSDNILMGAGARRQGASWLSIGVALVAGVIGTILLPPFGGLIAAPLGVFLFEYLRLREARKAWKATIGMATGWGLSFVARFLLAFLMMVLWWIWVWKG